MIMKQSYVTKIYYIIKWIKLHTDEKSRSSALPRGAGAGSCEGDGAILVVANGLGGSALDGKCILKLS